MAKQKEKLHKGMIVLNIFKGIIVRLLFILHASSSLILLYNNNNLDVVHAAFLIPLLLLLVESFVTIFCYAGEESRYIWWCGLFYILTITPVVWVLELGVLKSKIEIEEKTIIDAKRQRGRIGHFRGIESKLLEDLLNLDGRKFCEVGVITCLIAGRWLSPRTSMSRQTLSAMLLSYVANAADILDLFTSLQAPELVNHDDVTFGILGVYTWSLLQFAIVATVVYKKGKKRHKRVRRNKGNDASMDRKSIQSEKKKKMQKEKDYDTKSIGTIGTVCTVTSDVEANKKQKNRLQKIPPEFPQLLIGLLMQDGPFLLLRLVLCVKYDVYDELHIFFLLKNSVVCTLLLYRIILVYRDYIKASMAGGANNIQSGGVSEKLSVESSDEEMFDPYRMTSYI